MASEEPTDACGNVNNLRSLIYVPAATVSVSGDEKHQDGGAAGSTASTPPSLKVLDQLLLPTRKVYVDISNVQDAWRAIHTMQIRGAPLIAIVAVLGLAIDLRRHGPTIHDIDRMVDVHPPDRLAGPLAAYIQGKMDYLATSRPTAVNLFNALQEVKSIVTQAAADVATATEDSPTTTSSPPRDRIITAIVQYAEFMLHRDEADCRAIGQYGAAAILEGNDNKPDDEEEDDDEGRRQQVTIMTICNTGSLATAGYGTALGVVRAIHEQGRLRHVIVLETRPYNQGSRLTAFECVEDRLAGATLICDGMAAYYMAKRPVAAVVVGADRVAANGDTANKIGTYSLAVAAMAHSVPFYVAAPFTTLDLAVADGDEIPIEQRPASELLETARAPAGIAVWNPSFDVTPARYITGGIVTEKGVIRPVDGTLDVKAFVVQHSS